MSASTQQTLVRGLLQICHAEGIRLYAEKSRGIHRTLQLAILGTVNILRKEMKFELYEIVTILKLILNTDIKMHSEKMYYTDEQLAVMDKFFSACQECPSMIIKIQSIMAKLQSPPPKSYRKKRKRKQK